MLAKTLKLVFILSTINLIVSAIQSTKTTKECERNEISDCVVFGEIHVKTFDGNVYNFESTCEYKLVSIESAKLDVNLLRDPTALQIKYSGNIYTLTISESLIHFTKDGFEYNIPHNFDELIISKPGRMVVIELNDIGMRIRFDGNTVQIVQDNENFDHKMIGFCGNNDGCADNDLITADGNTTDSQICYANSWTLDLCKTEPFENDCGDDDNLNAEALNYCTDLFALKQFSECWDYSVDFRDICISLYCECKLLNRRECMCDMLDAFVKTCNVNTNTATDWRDEDLCPINCTNIDKKFYPCAPNDGQISCGDDKIEHSSQHSCEEGCYCPPGMKLHEGKCIYAEDCPCYRDGKWYEPGSSVPDLPPQECNTCVCENGQWQCTEKICTDEGGCWGDPHFTTFDGRKYDFMGKCSYYVVRGNGFDIICDHFIRRSNAFVKDYESALPSHCARVIIEVENNIISLEQNHVVRINDQQISWLPHSVSGIQISRPSSQFTQVTLRNHVGISWSGYDRITVSVPTTMRGHIYGLFGTYNKDQSDDFTLPNGTIVNDANTFGHSWVVPGSCGSENVNTDPVPHPCDVNPAMKPISEKNCAVLKSPLFEGCSDDVESSYEECVFDGCMCPDDSPSCLCDFYAQQGEMCAARGILIDWREEIPECGIQCPSGQKYQICGNSCTRGCDDISANPTCTSRCIDGCNCPPGQTLDNNDQCIQIAECPCVLDNTRYPANFTFIETSDDKNNKHVCENALWTITPATDEDLIDYPSLEDFENKCYREDFLVFSGCKRINEVNCWNIHLNERPNFDGCQSGCECMQGYIMDTELNKCVKPEDCPCLHQGISHPDDAIINNRNERCVCVYGHWECSPQSDHWEKCSVWGNIHVRSFDETFYTFTGFCEYTIFEHNFEDSGVIRVTIMAGSCPSGSCIQRLSILFRSNSGHTENVFFTQNDFFSSTNLTQLNITDMGLSTFIDVLDFDVRIVWNRDGWVHIHLSQEWLSKEHFGLCGKYDNDPSNDLKILGIETPSEFVDFNTNDRTCGKSTELTPINGMFPEHQCNILYTNIFRECRFLKPVDDYFNRCIIDAKSQLSLPESERSDYYCQSIGAYAQECNDVGVVVNWRSDSICPNSCPLDKDYYPCKVICTEQSCEENGMCFEGCGPIKCTDDD
ncbi:von Willebrand factor-like [Onthophagus taurus]|uniref:von Willebrand factor-like n=1 Tax=Onthophagus taurus TaxID=166361 RepID=UPI0039BE80A6